jgi:DNA-binding NarL/FixJ family response regulator
VNPVALGNHTYLSRANQTIASTLSIGHHAVEHHMRNAPQRLGTQNRTGAATHAVRAGLLDPESLG